MNCKHTLLLFFALATQAAEVFTSGQEGYNTYRIPSILQTKRHTLLAFAEGRKQNSHDAGDIDVLLKRSRDGGRTWSPAITVADFGADTIGNPAPVLDQRTGTIWLLLTSNPGNVAEKDIQPGISGPTRTVWVTHSQDDGLSWAKPTEITAAVKRPEWSWYATGPVNGIQLRSGRLIIPCDHRRGEGPQGLYSHIIFSDDAGATWKLGGTSGPGTNESTIAELPNGQLLLNMRGMTGTNHRAVATSTDSGLTFTTPQWQETLIEPVCQASLLLFGKGRKAVLLFSNPAAKTRTNMTIRLSRDGGQTWPLSKQIHPGPAAYSNLIALDGKTIGLLYERGQKSPYQRITFTRIPLASLEPVKP